MGSPKKLEKGGGGKWDFQGEKPPKPVRDHVKEYQSSE